MTLWLHEISEADHRILNPFTDDKLMLLGAVSRVGPGTRILDLCCGKGELLCRWAQVYGAGGHGVDISRVFLAAAAARAQECAWRPGSRSRRPTRAATPPTGPTTSCPASARRGSAAGWSARSR